MTAKKSRSIGGKQSIKGAAIIFLAFELVMLFVETKGDFANGLLFFISAQLNGIFLLIVIIYFLIMYLVGRQVGLRILIKNNPYYFTGLAGGFTATLIIITGNLLTMLLFRSHDYNYSNNEIAIISIRYFCYLIMPMWLAWLWVAYQIKAKETAFIQ